MFPFNEARILELSLKYSAWPLKPPLPSFSILEKIILQATVGGL